MELFYNRLFNNLVKFYRYTNLWIFIIFSLSIYNNIIWNTFMVCINRNYRYNNMNAHLGITYAIIVGAISISLILFSSSSSLIKIIISLELLLLSIGILF